MQCEQFLVKTVVVIDVFGGSLLPLARSSGYSVMLVLFGSSMNFAIGVVAFREARALVMCRIVSSASTDLFC